MSPKTLPVIHLPLLKAAGNSGHHRWQLAVHQVRRAFEDYGCFVTDHEHIPVETRENFFESLEELFALPEETKAGSADKEKYIFHLSLSADNPFTEAFTIRDGPGLDGTQQFTNALWPTGNDTFCKHTLALTDRLGELVGTVQKMILEGYGADSYTDDGSDEYIYRLGLAKQEQKIPISETVKHGMSHSDKAFLTVFYQNDVKDLEVLTKDGKHWLPFHPSPSRVLFMAGQPLAGWSNGRIHAPTHVHGQTEQTGEVNYAVTLTSVMLGITQTPEELVDDEHPLLFKPFSGLEFLNLTESDLTATLASYCGVDNN